MKHLPFLVFIPVLFISGIASARTWYIRLDGTGDTPTIQAATDLAASGDTVLLDDGIYIGEGNRDIYVEHKSITVMSEHGEPSQCIIHRDGAKNYIS